MGCLTLSIPPNLWKEPCRISLDEVLIQAGPKQGAGGSCPAASAGQVGAQRPHEPRTARPEQGQEWLLKIRAWVQRADVTVIPGCPYAQLRSPPTRRCKMHGQPPALGHPVHHGSHRLRPASMGHSSDVHADASAESGLVECPSEAHADELAGGGPASQGPSLQIWAWGGLNISDAVTVVAGGLESVLRQAQGPASSAGRSACGCRPGAQSIMDLLPDPGLTSAARHAGHLGWLRLGGECSQTWSQI